jgi:hypothetical protein
LAGNLTKPQVEPRPPRRKGEISQLFVAVTDSEEGEQIYTVLGPAGEKIPLTAINAIGVANLRLYAQRVADRDGNDVFIIRFTGRALYETVSPRTTGD